MEAQTKPIAYGVKLIFTDGTVVNWYRDSKRKTVYAEKNPAGHALPPSDPTGEAILMAMNLAGNAGLRRLLGLPSTRPAPASKSSGGIPTAAFDGGCKPNPGPGGWGIVLPDGREMKGGSLQTTNNRMELTAAIKLLESTKGPVRILGDSSYVILGATQWMPAWIRRGWLKADGEPVGNRDLWERLADLIKGRKLSWEQVRGHSGHPLNERCDQLATRAREEILSGG